MLDIETQIRQVRNTDSRLLADDAFRAYSAGALRSSIAMTWAAVCADLIAKIAYLAEDGDGNAREYSAKVQAAQAAGLTRDGVSKMQEVERTILDKAVALELIDTITAQELDRVREDRHLCVHPSLRPLGETYEPRPEVARAHLAIALDSLLVHPPIQGRKLLAIFKEHLADPYFVASESHLLAAFFDRVRSSTKREIINLAAKHALLELPAPDPLAADTLADRMAACLAAFASRDRSAVQQALSGLWEKFLTLENDRLLRAVARLGHLDEFWEIVDPAMAEKVNLLLPGLIVREPNKHGYRGVTTTFRAGGHTVLALVRVHRAREKLADLESQFNALPMELKWQVMAGRPDPYFTALVAGLVADVGSFRSAEGLAEGVVVPHARWFTTAELRAVMEAWAGNDQCTRASEMPALAVQLYERTGHLPGSRVVWEEFLASVGRVAPDDPAYEWYRYADLEAAMNPGTGRWGEALFA